MGSATGIVRSNSGRLSDILIELFLVPDGFGEHLPVRSRRDLVGLGAERLGSAIADVAGQFRIEFDASKSADHGAKAPLNLWLMASKNGPSGAVIVYQEADLRRRSGATESFVVFVGDEHLKRAPQFEAAPKVIREDFAATTHVLGAFADTVKTKQSEKTERRGRFRREVANGLRAQMSTVIRKANGTPADQDFVDADANLTDKADRRLRENLKDRFELEATKPLVLPGRVSLTDAQLAALRSLAPGGGNGTEVEVLEEDLRRVLRTVGTGDNPSAYETSILRSEVVANFCRPKNKAELCLTEQVPTPTPAAPSTTSTTTTTTPTPTTNTATSGAAGSGVTPVDAYDGVSADELRARIAGYVSRVLNEVTVLDEVSARVPGPGSQLTEEQIRAAPSFPGLNLPPGPADTPAFYDFHKLQIAFKPLWSEALDDRLIADAEAAYDRYVELGGDPAQLTNVADWTHFTSVLETVLSINTPLPIAVATHIEITAEEWAMLPPDYRGKLSDLATQIASQKARIVEVESLSDHKLWDGVSSSDAEVFEGFLRFIGSKIATLQTDADRVVRFARAEIDRRSAASGLAPPHRILTALRTRALSAYPARYFAANRRDRSVNFGLLITYRQQWKPTAYQVGELIKSIPLAPRQSVKYSKKVTLKEKRSHKEMISNLTAQKSDSKSTSRAEAEIVQRAQQKTNYSANVSGSFKVGVFDASGSNTLTADAQADSAETKKSLHEAALSAAREYKDEFKVELETESSSESEFTESGELSNPNDELSVTFLIYELQRRFRVTERLNRLRSVVLVAQEMPAPADIDEDWLVANRWILNRVLLDDMFKVPLAYVAESMAAEENSLAEIKRSLTQQRNLVEELKGEVVTSREKTESRYGALQSSMERSAAAAQNKKDDGIFGAITRFSTPGIISSIAGRFLDDESPEAARVREAAARDAYERELERLRDFEGRLVQENNALAQQTRTYADRLSEHLGKVVRVAELQNHIKDNIIHYMQAIWLHEPPDQRWLRLKDVQVPDLEGAPRRLHINLEAIVGSLATPAHLKAKTYSFTARCGTKPPPGILPTRPRIEVADLDDLLGFKANYMIFALKTSNVLTRFMMQPYVEYAAEGFGLTDPDDLGNISLDEFNDYVCCLRQHLSQSDFAAMKDTLRNQLASLLQAPLRNDEEVVVPLDATYIEALPGTHPILENFKLLHRQIDAADAQENLRLKKLEKLRYAKRLLDGQLDDPDVSANYVFENAPGVSVSPPSPSPSPGGGP